MLLARSSEDCQTQNLGNNERRICRTVHPVVGKAIGRNALRMQRAEAHFIAEEGPARHRHATGKKGIDRGIEPDDGDALCAKEFGSAWLSVSAAAQRENDGLLRLRDAAEHGPKLLGFQRSKCWFAVPFEKFGDAQASGLFNAVVQIDEAPRELTRQERPDSGLTGAHESGEANDRGASCARARSWKLRHDTGTNEINRASGCELYH